MGSVQKERQTRKQTIKIQYDKGYDRSPNKMLWGTSADCHLTHVKEKIQS